MRKEEEMKTAVFFGEGKTTISTQKKKGGGRKLS
jgi:hypothetical protein